MVRWMRAWILWNSIICTWDNERVNFPLALDCATAEKDEAFKQLLAAAFPKTSA